MASVSESVLPRLKQRLIEIFRSPEFFIGGKLIMSSLNSFSDATCVKQILQEVYCLPT
jgi:hypothetical protein